MRSKNYQASKFISKAPTRPNHAYCNLSAISKVFRLYIIFLYKSYHALNKNDFFAFISSIYIINFILMDQLSFFIRFTHLAKIYICSLKNHIIRHILYINEQHLLQKIFKYVLCI
ncbi:hypothetical protein EDEG_01503 [Edhazardia aedis USNM 41457]|uniref:Uncharacterized protein n=1 Tax=Edhazardia aedis (strain USNM 41457) TaxID=1003232 RepID=J9DNT9_EDHAE|nr:hypothetical protein EDEG_01503 [Edhazardia aedis USNM 41457]|eukprot:EJW04205.1 hypothetical protein EDEG_01503 [Edhazardia aedis USNM 41457]